MNNYCGKWIRHGGWYPDIKLRLVRKEKAQWVGRNPHDRMELASGSNLQTLSGHILHYTVERIQDHVTQVNYFSELGSSG